MHIYMHIYIHIYIYIYIYAYIYIYIYIYMLYVSCMHIYIYMHICPKYMHIYRESAWSIPARQLLDLLALLVQKYKS